MMNIDIFNPKSNKNNPLNEFRQRLYSRGIYRPSFSYCNSEVDLISTLTIKENLQLKVSPFIDHFNPEDLILSTELKKRFLGFYKYIYDAKLKPSDSDIQSQKVASVLRTILANNDYLFFNEPEKYLSELASKALVLLFAELKKEKNVLISTPTLSLYYPIQFESEYFPKAI